MAEKILPEINFCIIFVTSTPRKNKSLATLLSQNLQQTKESKRILVSRANPLLKALLGRFSKLQPENTGINLAKHALNVSFCSILKRY